MTETTGGRYGGFIYRGPAESHCTKKQKHSGVCGGRERKDGGADGTDPIQNKRREGQAGYRPASDCNVYECGGGGNAGAYPAETNGMFGKRTGERTFTKTDDADP